MQSLNSVVSHPPETSSAKKPHIAPVEAISCKRKFEKLGSLVSGSKSKIKVANIDSGQQPISKPIKHKGKPRMKVKKMVDIYAIAKGCTLEDLDERNGTKWSVVSSYSKEVVSDKNKPEACNKRNNHSVVDEDAGGIGPVYIDATGQKLQIITEFKGNYISFSETHAIVSLSETVSSPSNSQNSWRRCWESQVSGKITKRERCSMHLDNVFASDGKSVLELKKEEEDEMTQERVLKDWDDSEEADKVFLSSNTSTSGGEKNCNILDKTNDSDDELVYERTGCERGGSTFMEVDDPIPIPGPPGSFLQSPWDMETEHHGNFSVITSHVKSSQDQLDLTDRNSSESAISNFAAPETQTFSLHNIITTVPSVPLNSNSVLRLMGKDLVVINQREDTSHEDSSQDLSKTQHVSPPIYHLYGGNSLYLNTS